MVRERWPRTLAVMDVTRTTGEAIVDGLIAHGVDTVFGIPGVQTYALFDALARAGDRITTYTGRHEQGPAYMAFGYAQATGRPGVFSVVPGPGMLNAASAILSGHGASVPMVCVTGEVPAAHMGRGLGQLHEMPDQLATMRTFTKWAANILHPAEAPGLVAEAFRQATSGRPRPVALASPWDTLAQSAPCPPCVPSSTAPPAPDPAAVERAAALVAGARNPMIMVGSGARAAGAEVLALARRLQAPVVSFRGGRGIVSDESPYGFNCAEGYERWAGTDVLIGIGSRLELMWGRWGAPPPGVRVALIDIDPAQRSRLAPAAAIVADAAAGTQALLDSLPASLVPADRSEEFAALKAKRQAEIADHLQPHVDHLSAIRRALPRDGFFVEEVCQVGFTSFLAFAVYSPRTFVTNGCQGALGFGVPTSLGVKAAYPDRAVVAVTGDGGFLFGATELATAVQHSLGVVTVVFNNDAYGNVLNDQRRLFDGRAIGSELRNPDFVALARAFGAEGVRVETPDELEKAVIDGIERDVPTVIEVPMPLDGERTPWPFLMPQRTGGAR